MIKYYIKAILRFFLKIFWIIPVDKDKIFFCSFMGSSVSCNPYYIFIELQKKFPKKKYIWCCNDNKYINRISFQNVKVVKFNSVKYILALISSRILINNASFPTWIPFRMKKQTVINTWHGGGAYKKVAASELDSKQMLKRVIQSSKDTSFFISSSKKFTEVMMPSTYIDEKKFLNFGMPRNDIFFDLGKSLKIKDSVLTKLAINEDCFIVLYAPTYRGLSFSIDSYDSHLDVENLKMAVEKRFNKKCVVLFRGHMFGDSSDISKFDYDVSGYQDMQELLCTVDMLITDYSSSMWDFSFTKKPCFIYATDLDSYIQDRGFYTEPITWGFPIAQSNNELYEKIINFVQTDYEKSIEQNHNYFGSFENGTAATKVCNFLINECLI